MNDCYFRLQHGNNSVLYELPCYPDEISDSVAPPMWNEDSPVGRSAPIFSFNGTGGGSVSFSFDLHREMSNGVPIENVLQLLRKSVYGRYSSSVVDAPISTFKFGEFIARGYVSNISFTNKKPIIDNEYQVISVSVELKRINRPISAGDLGRHLNPYNDTI